MAWLVAMEISHSFLHAMNPRKTILCGIILFGRSVNGSPCSTRTSVVCAHKGVTHIVNDGSPFKLKRTNKFLQSQTPSSFFLFNFLIIGLFMRMTHRAFDVSPLWNKTLWDLQIPPNALFMLFSVTDTIDEWSIVDT